MIYALYLRYSAVPRVRLEEMAEERRLREEKRRKTTEAESTTRDT